MSDEPTIVSDVITERNGEPYREIVEYDGGPVEMGWRIDNTDASLLDKCRSIVERESAAEIDGTLVDLFTASAIVQVYDALKPENQQKFIERANGDIVRLADLTWRLLK